MTKPLYHFRLERGPLPNRFSSGFSWWKSRYRSLSWGRQQTAEKDLGVLVNAKLNVSQKSALAAKRVNGILGFIRQSTASSLTEVILALCSPLVRHHLEDCVQCWAPQYKKHMDILERVQQTAVRMMKGQESICRMRKAWEVWDCSAWVRESSGRSHWCI